MAWLFERTIELAAWVAMIVAWVSAVLAAIWIVRWFGSLKTGAENELLWDSARAAAGFVGSALALALLAAIDRFIFDADQARA
jgi:O-antigen/teichoic acid export membrane protein